jgi:hypothetical protein
MLAAAQVTAAAAHIQTLNQNQHYLYAGLELLAVYAAYFNLTLLLPSY